MTNRMRHLRDCVLVLLIMLGGPAALAADSGWATRDLEIREAPKGDAKAVGRLAKGGRYELVSEQAAWTQIRVQGLRGWVLSFYLMPGPSPAERSVGQSVSEFVALGTDRRPQSNSVIGIRGLDEEQLRSAQFNDAELKRLESYSQPAGAGGAFAAEARLQRQRVDEIPASTSVSTGPAQ